MWLYLFFLPFQLVDDFGWYTIPGVAVAAFIYLGFLAAGEEIEQPFGAFFVLPSSFAMLTILILQATTTYDKLRLYSTFL